jgi:hypothetical protein
MNIFTKHYLFRVTMATLTGFILCMNAAQACRIIQIDDELIVKISTDCTLDHAPGSVLPNMRVENVILEGTNATGLFIQFSVANTSPTDSDKGISFGSSNSTGFDVEAFINVTSEDGKSDYIYDYFAQQNLSSAHFMDRISSLGGYETKHYNLGSATDYQYHLPDRDKSYKIELIVGVDSPKPSSISSSYGDVLETNENDNSFRHECLILGKNVSDPSEILEIDVFHYENNKEMPVLPTC